MKPKKTVPTTEAFAELQTRLEQLKRHPSRTYKQIVSMWLLESYIKYWRAKFEWKRPEYSGRFLGVIVPVVATFKYLQEQVSDFLDDEALRFYEQELKNVLLTYMPDKERDINYVFEHGYANDVFIRSRYTQLTKALSMALNTRLEIAKLAEIWDLLTLQEKQSLINGQGLKNSRLKELAEALGKSASALYRLVRNFKDRLANILNWSASKVSSFFRRTVSNLINTWQKIIARANILVNQVINQIGLRAKIVNDYLVIAVSNFSADNTKQAIVDICDQIFDQVYHDIIIDEATYKRVLQPILDKVVFVDSYFYKNIDKLFDKVETMSLGQAIYLVKFNLFA